MLSRIDRYILRELLKPFVFFIVVFTGVIWLTQSLRVIETIVNSGQNAGVFLQFILLLLPSVMGLVLPIAAFAATLYAVNRLFSESELVAMLAAGMGTLALARPVILFGAAAATAAAVATIWLAPVSQREMRARVHDLRADIANALVFEGRFLHPARGLTIYVRENRGGELLDVFVHDSRDPAAELTYTASRAILSREGETARLVMFDGAVQRLDAAGALSLLAFDSFVYDLTQFMQGAEDRAIKPAERGLRELVAPPPALLAGGSAGRFLSEGHERLAGPLYALALPLIGLAAILAPGFARRGYGKRIALAVTAGVLLRALGFAAKSLTASAAWAWPLLYAPPLLGAAVALWALAGQGRAVRRRAGAPSGAAPAEAAPVEAAP